jgi:hypothetical protein
LLGESVVQRLPAHPLDWGYGPTVGEPPVDLDELRNTGAWLLSLVRIVGGLIVVRSRSLTPFIG